jgi:hypothetical protein
LRNEAQEDATPRTGPQSISVGSLQLCFPESIAIHTWGCGVSPVFAANDGAWSFAKYRARDGRFWAAANQRLRRGGSPDADAVCP